MKTHLLTKKRALISSVAMLLVAIIALGTATFAWFTKNTQATADKLSVKTIKASELQLSKQTGDWSDQIHYDYMDQTLKPASSVDGTNWFTAVAKGQSSYVSADGDAENISEKLDGYVFKEQLNVRNNGKAAVENVKIKFHLKETEANNGKYVRLALVPASKRGADATVTKEDFKKSVFAAGIDSAKALVDATKQEELVTALDGTNGEVKVGNLAGKDDKTEGAVSVKYYNLYVWFEGQDEDCKNANSGNDMPEVKFTVEGDPVKQPGEDTPEPNPQP